MNEDLAKKILNKTKDDYNRIADSFSRTREDLTPDLLELKKYYKKGQKVLDLGCGNGRLSELFDDGDYVGIDTSAKLIEIAKKKYPQKNFQLQQEPLAIPLSENSFDVIFCLAVFHHIPSDEYRKKFIDEIYRVLKKNGKLILTVWNLFKEKKLVDSLGKESDLDSGDIIMNFFHDKSQRYLHAFTEEELVKILSGNGFKIKQIGENYRTKSSDPSRRHYNIEVIAAK